MIVITGVSGDLGKRIADQLAKVASPAGFRLTSRTPEKLAHYQALGFETAAFNFDDANSMDSALAGAETLLIISGDAPNDVRIRQHRAALESAKKSGVKRIVYTSFANPSAESLFSFADIHRDTEAAIAESGLNYTILRNPMYAENIAGALQHAFETGELSLPSVQGRGTYMLKDDIAALTVNALIKAPGDKTTHVLTGSKALTLSDIAAEASRVWAKPIRVSKMPMDVFKQMLEGFGLPEYLIQALEGMHHAIDANEYAEVNGEAVRLLGREPLAIEAILNQFN